MRTKTLTFLFCFLLVFSFVLAVRTQADQNNKKTVITVSEPLRIPGATLQPGKYVFKLVDSLADRHIVRVTNEDESQVIATILAIPNYRLEATGKSEFQMWEVPAGQPAALRAWFYPGDNFGQEFAYPKHVAVEIGANVPTISDEMEAKLAAQTKVDEPVSEEFKTTVITAEAKPAQAETTAAAAAATTTTTSTPPVEPAATKPEPATAPVAPPPAPAPAPAAAQPPAEPQQPAAEELPNTASPFPLIGLLGLLSMGASAAIRFARR